MTDNFKALKLADRHMVATVAIVEIGRREFHIETATMLRRQAAEIARLQSVIREAMPFAMTMGQEILRKAFDADRTALKEQPK